MKGCPETFNHQIENIIAVMEFLTKLQLHIIRIGTPNAAGFIIDDRFPSLDRRTFSCILIYLPYILSGGQVIVKGYDINQIRRGIQMLFQFMPHRNRRIVIQFPYHPALKSQIMLDFPVPGFIFPLRTVSQIIITEGFIIDIPHQQVRFVFQQLYYCRQKFPFAFPFFCGQKLIAAYLVAAGKNRHNAHPMSGAETGIIQDSLFHLFRFPVPVLLPYPGTDGINPQPLGKPKFSVELLHRNAFSGSMMDTTDFTVIRFDSVFPGFHFFLHSLSDFPETNLRRSCHNSL